MLMDIANLHLVVVTTVTREGLSLLPVMLSKYSGNFLAKDFLVGLISTTTNNPRLPEPVYIRYCMLVAMVYLLSHHKVSLNLSFVEAVEGCSRELSFRVQGVCERCSGTKSEPGAKRSKCPYCKGSGEVRKGRQFNLSNEICDYRK